MKVYALAILLVFCIVENTSADWKYDVRIFHWQLINANVQTIVGKLRADANKKNTPAAQKCVEQAEDELQKISDRGYNGLTICVNSTTNSDIASLCAHEIDSQAYKESSSVQRSAGTCINNA